MRLLLFRLAFKVFPVTFKFVAVVDNDENDIVNFGVSVDCTVLGLTFVIDEVELQLLSCFICGCDSPTELIKSIPSSSPSSISLALLLLLPLLLLLLLLLL